jgi:hypothetical protein
LGILLSNVLTKTEIATRLQQFEKLRFNRASAVQILSNVGYDEVDRVQESLQPYVGEQPLRKSKLAQSDFYRVPSTDIGLHQVSRKEHQDYLFTHSVEQMAMQVLEDIKNSTSCSTIVTQPAGLDAHVKVAQIKTQ